MAIQVFKTTEEQNIAAAEIFVEAAKKAISRSGKFNVALTGGSSPVKFHKLLAESPYREQVEWEKVSIYWGDERWVPLDDDKSNAKMAEETLLSHVPIPADQIHFMWAADVEPEDYAAEYEQLLRDNLGPEGSFDLIFLGMGYDGHTASLFPGEAVLSEKDKWVDAYFLAPQDMYRITLTAPLINKAKKIAFVLYGEKKIHALKEVLEGEHNPTKYPSQLIKPVNGELVFLVDEVAASGLANK
ncbi:6-phosphogluconolactonase [Mucilaginibacter polytrichastri]|uniref:6-phosphogluconolactonase n=1 Tax=Mucilaginibacter polytrichastri TaxID=1302689 RepID=A0A1Q5ZYN6_9SPHI|nr:6-phosphogluconolactonase [Mucilaginibacter polytrichastri]OKS86861.1 6-phosphogluconolactonase [Mucilaginibacter polytrichastri]SFT17530.1 6-phosphogluconolactonase [Mucilaginibacter polytrichastri]